MSKDNKEGYTSVCLKEYLDRVDEQANELGWNRSLTMREILKAYYGLKDKGIDILKDADEIEKEMR